uniref:Putative ovule protein n=1 Tax=Solanum chacoense TaxID=4108 RepID=A0A0V0HYY7_SOLCH
MSIVSQNFFTAPHTRINLFCLKNPKISTPLHLKPLKTPLIFRTQKPHLDKIEFLQCHQWKVKSFDSEGTVNGQVSAEYEFNFDGFLSILEFLCLLSSAVVAIGFAVNSWVLGSQKWLGNRVLAAQCVVLVGGVIIGSVIRRRQWRRICMNKFSRSGSDLKGVNLLERIEKVEEDLRSSATIIRVLTRQLEKLGIRFRVTRKTLKDPITEAAMLAQKSSEATRALALQGERLEKELGEIQKVLLAMQDQQHKQLELILAIGKTGKLFENKRGLGQDPNKKTNDVSNTAADEFPQLGVNQIQALKRQRETNNDRI